MITALAIGCPADSLQASDTSLDAMMLKPLPERLRDAEANFDARRYREAAEEYEVLARFGSKTAQYRLAVMCLDGLGMPADRVQGWVWAALAAEFEQVNYARLRDETWATLYPERQRAAWARYLDQSQRYSDAAVARSLMIKARRKLGTDSIARGVRRDGSIKTYRGTGMKGDVLAGDDVLGILRQVRRVAESHYRGEHVTLGEFEVLDDDPDPQPPRAAEEPESGEEPGSDQEPGSG